MKNILLAVFAGAAALSLAATAHADPDSAYLNALSASGIPVDAGNSKALLGLGQAACADLNKGASAQSAAAQVLSMAPRGATAKQAANLVAVAQVNLCPDTKQ